MLIELEETIAAVLDSSDIVFDERTQRRLRNALCNDANFETLASLDDRDVIYLAIKGLRGLYTGYGVVKLEKAGINLEELEELEVIYADYL